MTILKSPLRSTTRSPLRGALESRFGDTNPLSISAPSFALIVADLPYDINAANSNQVVATDADAGGGDFTWTIALTGDGTPTMTIDATPRAGLAFAVGDGVADANMTFDATVAEFNAIFVTGTTFTQGTPGAGSVSIAYTMTDGTNATARTAIATIAAASVGQPIGLLLALTKAA